MEIVISNSGPATKPFLHKIKLVQGNIVDQEVDAVVTTIPKNMQHVGSLNSSIIGAAGRQLDDFILENIYKPKAGDVYAVPGFNLPAEHVLIGVMPYFRTEFDKDDRYLIGCMRNIMELASRMGLRRIAFPPVSSGKTGYPKARAARLLIKGVTDRLDEGFSEVRIVCPDNASFDSYHSKLSNIGWEG